MSAEESAGEAAPARAKRKHPTWLIAIEILTVLIVVAPLVAALLASNPGSSGGASGGTFQVGLRNDSAATVSLSTCASGCASVAVLTPGSLTEVAASDRGTVTRYYLLDATGAATGCLPLRFTKAETGLMLLTSQAVACPGSPISP